MKSFEVLKNFRSCISTFPPGWSAALTAVTANLVTYLIVRGSARGGQLAEHLVNSNISIIYVVYITKLPNTFRQNQTECRISN